MDVDLIFKIAAVGILVAVLNLVLVLMMLVQQISDLFDLVKTLFSL